MAVLRRALAYFGLVFGAGFVLGTLRTFVVAPRLGERAAELVEMPLMLAVIVLAARFVVRRGPSLASQAWLAVGALALGLVLAADVAVGVFLRGFTVVESLAKRDLLTGALYYASLAAYAVMPWLFARRDGGRRVP